MSELLDQFDAVVSRADGYPSWARLLFLVTFALVVACAVVYAVLYTRLRRTAAEAAPEATVAAPGE